MHESNLFLFVRTKTMNVEHTFWHNKYTADDFFSLYFFTAVFYAISFSLLDCLISFNSNFVYNISIYQLKYMCLVQIANKGFSVSHSVYTSIKCQKSQTNHMKSTLHPFISQQNKWKCIVEKLIRKLWILYCFLLFFFF